MSGKVVNGAAKKSVKRLACERFGRLIKKFPRGSISRLAGLLGVRKEAISKWISGEKPIPLEHLPAVARFLGVTVDYLLTHEEAHDAKPVVLVPRIGISLDPVSTPDTKLLELASGFVPVGTTEDVSNLYAIEVSQSSMAPKIEPSDLVVCHRTRPVINGDIVHYTVDGTSGIGRYFSANTGAVKICDETDTIVEVPKDSIRVAMCCMVVRQLRCN